jgi:transketolase
VLSRQALPAMPRDEAAAAGIALGGYRLRGETRRLSLVLAATGSEVQLAVGAASVLEAAGHGVRVVSLPCVERFLAQPAQFRDAVLPRDVPVLGIEAGHPAGLATVLGPGAEVQGIASFGESAPGPQLMKHFGFTVEAVVERAIRMLHIREEK